MLHSGIFYAFLFYVLQTISTLIYAYYEPVFLCLNACRTRRDNCFKIFYRILIPRLEPTSVCTSALLLYCCCGVTVPIIQTLYIPFLLFLLIRMSIYYFFVRSSHLSPFHLFICFFILLNIGLFLLFCPLPFENFNGSWI